ncbi:hypothetical protein HDU76_006310, partial [Blyttiomyces sp. JEL0837]
STNNDSTNAPIVAQLNESCGGNRVNAAVCASGLSCYHENSISGDVGGKCRVVSQLNGVCGGNRADAPICASGLSCWSQSGVLVGDIGGNCKTVSQRGGKCDGNAYVCDKGLTCVSVFSTGFCI